MIKFNFGDLIIGNAGASRYSYTRPQTRWVVIDPKCTRRADCDIYVMRHKDFLRHKDSLVKNHKDIPFYAECWPVDSRHFDFVENLILTSNKARAPHVLTRYDD